VHEHDYTDLGGATGASWTTHWSLIENARNGNQRENQHLIGLLIKRYWKPVYCYLRRKGYDNERAKDLTQGFFHEVVLGRHLIENADPAKGRFRSFLLTSLDHYLANIHRAEAAQKRTPRGKLVPLDVVEPVELPSVMDTMGPEKAYHYVWITELLERVLVEVKTECEKDSMMPHWNVLNERILIPILKQTPAPSLKEICKKYSIANETKASNMVVTMKRRLQAALRLRLSETVISPGQLTSELDDIHRFFQVSAQESG